MMGKSSVTIRDVARKAGVSAGTVSRAVNDSPLVRPETRQRIIEIVKEMGYTPNPAARRLSIGKTLTIAVMVPFFTTPSVSERLSGAISLLSGTEYDLVIRDIETPQQRDVCFATIPSRKQIDGLLIISLSPRDSEVVSLLRAEVPVVMIDADHPALSSFSRVVVNDVAGGRMAVEYLLQLGHMRIGFVGDNADNPYNFVSSRDRYWGYCQALTAANIPIRAAYYAAGDDHGRREARIQAQQILSLSDRPTAILAASDVQAIGVLEAAGDVGLRVPQDLSVMGYDDLEIADMLGLSTIHQPLFESGQRGVELLLEKLEDPEVLPVYEVMPTDLVVRRTTAPAPIN